MQINVLVKDLLDPLDTAKNIIDRPAPLQEWLRIYAVFKNVEDPLKIMLIAECSGVEPVVE